MASARHPTPATAVGHKETMSNVKFHKSSQRASSSRNGEDCEEETFVTETSIRQSLEDYRRKIRFKQVKFSIIVLTWQSAIMVLRYRDSIKTDAFRDKLIPNSIL